MSKLGISTGTIPNDGTGDSLLQGAIKINNNFDEIYNYFGDGTNLNYTSTGSWSVGGTGIHTLTSVGIGTTNPTSTLTVNGDARVTGIFTVGSASITLNGTTNTLNVGSGVTIYGNTGIVSASSFYANGLQVGVVTASTIIYEGATLYNAWQKTDVGIHTLSNVGVGTTNPTSKLTVYNGSFSISNPGKNPLDISQLVDDSWIIRSSSNVPITIGPANTVRLTVNNSGISVNGIATATSFRGSGTNLTGIVTSIAAGSGISIDQSTGNVTITATGGGISGIGVSDDGSSIGVATAINFGTGLSVSAVSAGIVTITSIPTNNFYDGGIVTGITTLTSANKNQLIPVSTASSITVYLPAGSGLIAGDGFTIVDVGSSETSSGNAATYNITVTPDGSDKILGGTGPLIIDQNGASVKLVWMGSTYDWRII